MKRTIAALFAAPIGFLVIVLMATQLPPGSRVGPPTVAGANRMATPTPRVIPAGTVAFTNAVLGYRIDLPTGYRPLRARVTGDPVDLGHDAYTLRSAQAERELCSSESGSGLQSLEREADIRVMVHRDVRGISAVDWIRAQRIPFSSAEPLTIGGLEAARMVQQETGETGFIVIRANGRIYELRPEVIVLPSLQPRGWLDQIAAGFRAITPAPAGTPTPFVPGCGS